MYATQQKNIGGLIVKLSDKSIIICDCGGTMSIDGANLAKSLSLHKVPTVHHNLCTKELIHFENELGNQPIIVGCTQERRLFNRTGAKHGFDKGLHSINIREHAAWGKEAAQAQPKIAALLAAGGVVAPLVQSVTLSSTGRVLVYGRDEVALEAANQLASRRFDVTLLLDGTEPIAPPSIMEIEIFFGHIRDARGHLGAFTIVSEGFAKANPSARAELSYLQKQDRVELETDLILDLSGSNSLFPNAGKREGYFKPDPKNPALVQRALFDLVDFIGTFDKPKYVDYKESLCVHSRSQKIGCSKCIDNCPNSAIKSAGDGVSVDAYVCEGCGQCTSLCPTGAVSYAFPPAGIDLERLRILLTTFRTAGGVAPVVLVYDDSGNDILNAIGRFGQGLPANVIPYEVNEVTVIGLDALLFARAYGAEHLIILNQNIGSDDLHALESSIEVVKNIYSGLAIRGNCDVLDMTDPDILEGRLQTISASALQNPDPIFKPATFLPMGNKRDRLWLALDYLYDKVGPMKEAASLTVGAPFGSVSVRVEECTLCLACVSACPTGALLDNEERPELSFVERACVQCGLCRVTCPESVISLQPQIEFRDRARLPRILKQEEPFKCIRCEKPFGVRSSVERIVEQLRDHPMFSGENNSLDRIRMCEDCRVTAQFDTKEPLARGVRPKIRTADD